MTTKVEKTILCDGEGCNESCPAEFFKTMEKDDWFVFSMADSHYCSIECMESDF